MTGIERLRSLSAGWDEMGLGGVLADVADQIERELSEERRRRSRDWREVSQVHREMRQRLFGHDPAGADLLSRWAERLLAAVCSQAAGDDAPVGAYDLLPEDMGWLVEAWPRFEDDAPVRFGDMALIDGVADMVEAVQLWIHGRPVIYGDGGSQQLEGGERVKRPAPKVLDADGVEIRVGDTVWTTRDLDKFTVTNPNNGKFLSVSCKGEDGEDYCCSPTDLTHRAPVLAADGRPLREGETVWGTGREEHEYVVLGQPGLGGGAGRFKVACHDVTDDVDCDCDPDLLTHKHPDSCERITEDIASPYCADCCIKYGVDHSGMSFEYAKACDIVRRAKALAERDR